MDFMRNNKTYCDICQRQFKSHLSLVMHYMNSKYHRKGSEHYHHLDKKKDEKQNPGITDENQLTLDIWNDICCEMFRFAVITGNIKKSKNASGGFTLTTGKPMCHIYYCPFCGIQINTKKTKKGEKNVC